MPTSHTCHRPDPDSGSRCLSSRSCLLRGRLVATNTEFNRSGPRSSVRPSFRREIERLGRCDGSQAIDLTVFWRQTTGFRTSQHQALHQRHSSGHGRRNVNRETGNMADNRPDTAKRYHDNFGHADHTFGKKGGYESPSRDRLLFLTTSLIGHNVEVQVKNGSIFTGIFHAASTEKELGIILKMAQMKKEPSGKGQKSLSDSACNASSMTVLIPSKELVQVIAKDVPWTGCHTNGNAHERGLDIMTDSLISQSHYVDNERELQPWIPDEDIPQCPELENVFNNTWSRNWNQFEVNKALFGVKSTFDEELYTTKLEKGSQMKELEREALRIAREIEGEDTQDIHLAEERGIHLPEAFEIDEESRFSSVQRVGDDGVWEENDGTLWDAANSQTFSVLSESGAEPFVSKKENSMPCLTESRSKSGSQASSSTASVVHEEGQLLKLEGELEVQSSQNAKKDCLDKDYPSSEEVSDSALSGKMNLPIPAVSNLTRSGCVISPASECVASICDSSGHPPSPSSSVGSMSWTKSTLNPNAKEFKLNPHAKSFTPSVTPIRPPSPASEGSFYLSPNVSGIPPIPVGIGVAHSFGGHQSIIYNSQSAPMPSSQGYYANGPMYGQQVFVGQPRQVLYMPTYPPEFQFKGREY